MSRNIHARVLVVLLLTAASAQAQPKNVLFYGNSFTLGFGSTDSVNGLFEDIATAAGHEPPLVQSAAASGQSLNWHLNNNTASIFTLIPPDRDWDFVVLQEHSTKLTRAFTGSPSFPASIEQSKADAVGLYEAVASRSFGVVPVLYETWARGPGHAFYGGANPQFVNPAEMQDEIRDGYDALKMAIDDEVGSELALIAPVGDAWKNADYDHLHANDLWHAGNRGTLLAALVIYGTVYDDTSTRAIDLSSLLASLNLTAADGAFLTRIADRTLVPEPSSAALIAVVLLSLVAARRRC